mmetsp:Transcript_138467/g.442566  ORF Transcript_138467/g.442566 Transcript_138467/m.442566 type:complete len:351 (-) Transcript_138467:393-1445(-)
MCLFEQELAQAHEANRLSQRQRGSDRKDSTSPALQHVASSSSSERPSPPNGQQPQPQLQVGEASNAPSGPRPTHLVATVLVICFAGIAGVFSMMQTSTFSGEQSVASIPNGCMALAGSQIANHTVADAVPNAVLGGSAAARPANTSTIVRSMREQGLHYLRISDCWQAEWFFKSALQQLEEEDKERAAELGSRGDEALAEQSRATLIGDRGFALVCAQRFSEGAKMIQQRIFREGYNQLPPHLINALGYAHFKMEDYKQADEAFERAVKADSANPILWNNLAAAKMVGGDMKGAGDALYHTFDKVQSQAAEFSVEEYYMHIFHSNVQHLVGRVGGKASGLPSIELWWPGQ